MSDLIVASVEHRFSLANKLPETIKLLTDNGTFYVAHDTKDFGKGFRLEPRATPVESLQPSGMDETFVCTWVPLFTVTPAKSVVHKRLIRLDSRLRWNDDFGVFRAVHLVFESELCFYCIKVGPRSHSRKFWQGGLDMFQSPKIEEICQLVEYACVQKNPPLTAEQVEKFTFLVDVDAIEQRFKALSYPKEKLNNYRLMPVGSCSLR